MTHRKIRRLRTNAGRRYLSTASALAAGIALTATVHAQSSDAPGTPAQSAPSGAAASSQDVPVPTLPTVTVNANRDTVADAVNPTTTVGSKIPLSQREIPQSVTVIPQEQIQQQSMRTLDDAMTYAPGVTVFHGDSDRSNYYARGFPIDTWLLDGMPTTQNLASIAPSLVMYDRVEVLNGPDGLLNGFGSPGGSINLVRKRAPSTFSANAEIYGGTSSHLGGDVDIGGPINAAGTLRGRVVASDSYQDLLQDSTWKRDKSVYGTLEADIARDTTVRVGASYERIDQKASWNGDPVYDNYAPVPVSRSTYFGAPWNHDSSDITTAFAGIEQKLGGGWKANLDFNYLENRYSLLNETLLTNVSSDNQVTFSSDKFNFDDKQESVNLMANGPFTLFGRQHQLTVGASYERESLTQTNYYCGASDNALLGSSGNFCEFTGSLYSNLSAEPAFDGPVYGRNTLTNQYGLYGNARFSLADPLTLVLGLRATWWNETYTPDAAENPFGDTNSHSSVTGKVTPYAGLIYDLNDQYSLYASYTSIFVPQTETDASGNIIKPIEGEQYEVGVKGDYMNGRLNTSLAVFQLTEKNRGMSDPRYPDEGFYIATGKARSRGVETTATGYITSDWSVFAGYTYTDTYYMDASVNPDYIGFSAISPKHLLKLWTDYRLPGELHRFSLGGGTYVSSGISATDGIGTVRQGGYATVDLRLGYQINKNLSASINVTNLFDRQYYESIASTGSLFYGDRREVLFTLRASL
ncbi:TonB-dependent siderophore receptor [Pararobbsia silviterrae]|uniref:TonB-dependent siderophore receptor n=1 Tax=Pararobbsia silviterrae TaxID=1792498 RepID=A0A494XAU3_9BURK|nr:TonB-dependent siderophore receptor [Pararobbsia silviterrae]RKP47678.1 TonB-dependent siderophore receptor [Pararobbsia silviterrae]